jgi:hypothetical protein
VIVVTFSFLTLCCFATSASATTLVNLATGFDQSSPGLISFGSLDDDWSLVSAPSGVTTGDAKVIVKNSSWFDPEPDARWISSQSATSGSTGLAPGTYQYQLLFSLIKDPNLIYSIAADYGSDDGVTDIKLNGNILVAGGGGFGGTTFPSSLLNDNQGFFNNGTNTLLATLANVGDGNPTGFVMRGSVSSEPIPEPATLLLLGSGLAGLGLLRISREPE